MGDDQAPILLPRFVDDLKNGAHKNKFENENDYIEYIEFQLQVATYMVETCKNILEKGEPNKNETSDFKL